MHRIITLTVAVAMALAAFSSCSNDPTLGGANTTGANINFVQIDGVGRPGIQEVFVPYALHDANNRSSPSGESAVLGPQINAFVGPSGFGLRSAATASYIQALLTPDVLIADFSQRTTTASYLGWETGGQISDNNCSVLGGPPNAFGGRGLTEDVVDATFGIVFGNTASHLTAPTPNVPAPQPADDGAETPTLTSDNVSCDTTNLTPTQFPYLGTPI
jgi:hypothetical protein